MSDVSLHHVREIMFSVMHLSQKLLQVSRDVTWLARRLHFLDVVLPYRWDVDVFYPARHTLEMVVLQDRVPHFIS